MMLTLILAFIFECGQYLEYVNARFSMSDGIFGRVFYFGTGFHGLHVIIGHVFLTVNYGMLRRGIVRRLNAGRFDIAVAY